MAINSVRAALQLLSGAGELTRARAMEAAATLLELPGVGDTSMRASQLAEELLQAATTNQQLVHDLVRTEFERQLTRLGLVSGSDLQDAQRRIETLEAEVAALRAEHSAAGTSADRGATTRKRPARSAVRRPTRRSASAATQTPGRAAEKTPAKKTPAKKTAASTKPAAAEVAAGTTRSTTRKSSAATPRRSARSAGRGGAE